MIRKSGTRFSEKIMRRQNARATIDSTENNFALGAPVHLYLMRGVSNFARLLRSEINLAGTVSKAARGFAT
jgi:hypothetical protein